RRTRRYSTTNITVATMTASTGAPYSTAMRMRVDMASSRDWARSLTLRSHRPTAAILPARAGGVLRTRRPVYPRQRGSGERLPGAHEDQGRREARTPAKLYARKDRALRSSG